MTFNYFKMLTDHLTDDIIKLEKVYKFMELYEQMETRDAGYIINRANELLKAEGSLNNLPSRGKGGY